MRSRPRALRSVPAALAFTWVCAAGVARAQDAPPPPPPSPASEPSTSSSPSSADSARAANEPGRVGAGPLIGNTLTGVGAKLWLSRGTALQGAIGTGPDGNYFRGQVAVLISVAQWRSTDGQYFVSFYFGAGGRGGAYFGDLKPYKSEFGVRVPFGIATLIVNSPIELFAEIAPDVQVRLDNMDDNHTVVVADGAIGLRYYY